MKKRTAAGEKISKAWDVPGRRERFASFWKDPDFIANMKAQRRARALALLPLPCKEHMPFAGHRTQQQVREHAEKFRRRLGRELEGEDRELDARRGSEQLRDAILRAQVGS